MYIKLASFPGAVSSVHYLSMFVDGQAASGTISLASPQFERVWLSTVSSSLSRKRRQRPMTPKDGFFIIVGLLVNRQG